jgi:thiamine biosynthesis lipoprotein
MHRTEHRFVAMGGPCRVCMDHLESATAAQAIALAESEVRRLEEKYSRYLSTSLTSVINANAGSARATEIDAETAGLLNYANTAFEQSGGLFDLTSGILRQAWDFKQQNVPSQQRINALLPHIGWDRVEWDSSSIYLPEEGMEIDFGGCVKEYAADSAANILQGADIEHALVDLAGDIATLGGQAHGEPWQIGIRHPHYKSRAIAQVPLTAVALASSGDYERCIVIDKKRYGHILNPKTGWPAQGLIAVSVIAEQCLVAGSSATIAMLKPAAEALQWLGQLGLPWLAIDAELECHGTMRAPD